MFFWQGQSARYYDNRKTGEAKTWNPIFQEEAKACQRLWEDHFTTKLPPNPLNPLLLANQDFDSLLELWMREEGKAWVDQLNLYKVGQQVGFQEMDCSPLRIPGQRIMRRSEIYLLLLKRPSRDTSIRILKKSDPAGTPRPSRDTRIEKLEDPKLC